MSQERMRAAEALARIAAALERLAPPPVDVGPLKAGVRFVFRAGALAPARLRDETPLDLLMCVEAQKAALLGNTRRFAAGAPANNALLWGGRGLGKSALVKAVHACVAEEVGPEAAPRLVEIPRDALPQVPALMAALADVEARTILFVDDLSFEGEDGAMKALKSALDGSLTGGGGEVLVYATSNRRHLVAREARENVPEDLAWGDTAEERLSLSDRFGLWLGFHAFDQDAYLAVVEAYARRLGFSDRPEALRAEAIRWALTRGARSGRTARQFILAAAAERGLSARW